MISTLRSKALYSETIEGTHINIQCDHNLNTGHNTISTRFTKSSNGGMNNNNTCSSYLGIYIAERLLSKIYNNVQVMEHNNHGYDFICGKGYKIDVKSSCLRTEWNGSWTFSIKRNKTADFFLCLAFDNRIDLNPQHIWLIPGNIINKRMCTSIAKSTLSKWSKYEQNNLNEIIFCCDDMKNKGELR